MNRYPYSSGHLLVLPFQHISDFTALDSATAAELTELCQKAVQALKQTFQPEGFNIGMNLGVAAGAGIPGHLHYHVLPRWVGDTNFLPIIDDTKIINDHLLSTYDKLVDKF